jgi:hypothetical protein
MTAAIILRCLGMACMGFLIMEITDNNWAAAACCLVTYGFGYSAGASSG